MAGCKGNTKQNKSKEIKNKPNRNAGQSGEDGEDIDYSLLRRPLTTSVTGFAQARKVFDLATEEVKGLLSNECNMIYECKVCTNLFRSLANFISHKRVYCAEKCSSVYTNSANTSIKNELLKIKRFEENYQEFLKESFKTINNTEIDDKRIPLSKDLTEIVEKIVSTKGVQDEKLNQQNVVLEKIPKSSVAVYQTLQLDSNEDAMCAQVTELDSILSKENAVMQSDGNFKVQNSSEEMENVIQISDDEENCCMQELKCKLCDQQFSTRKTLKFHIKTKHVASRLVYPCPDCLEIFSTSWSVYRHLFKVHRKTAAQIRRLRETIQSKAFHMNNPPASYEKRKTNAKPVTSVKMTDEERMEQENQAWMDNMEGDGELPRCGGCGRTFERRAALAAHTNTCQPRSRALARRPDPKKIEIQIRKDYNKGAPAKSQDKTTNEVVQPAPKTPLQKEDIEKRSDNTLSEAIMSIVGITGPEEPEVIEESIEKPDINMDVLKPVHILPFSHQAEKNNFNVLKQKVIQNVILEDLSCKKCENKFIELNELFDHVAGHYNWVRYACKLCKFRHYEYEKVSDHVKIVHKLKGDAEFYFSTIKAIDGAEATDISEPKDINESSPNSRRPSRCSSDSSKLSDDSSSSTTPVEVGRRKRKVNPIRTPAKRKINEEGDGDSKDSEPSPQKDPLQIYNDSSNSIGFNENSSDVDDSEASKRVKMDYVTSGISRRPIRKRTIPKNKDFEYDLSNLLKMQMHGYRESQTNINIKSAQAKKKIQQELISNYNALNKDCSGAMTTLSRQSVEKNKAHMITTDFAVYSNTKDQRISNIFVRPMLPKINRGDKVSPIKEQTVDLEQEASKKNAKPIDLKESVVGNDIIDIAKTLERKPEPDTAHIKTSDEIFENPTKNDEHETDLKDASSSNTSITKLPEKPQTNNNLVPIKLHKCGLDLIKNPFIKKNISDFSKIVVIKNFNKNDGSPSSLKFQRIKMNETQKSLKNDNKTSDPLAVFKAESVIPTVAVSVNNNASDDGNKGQEKDQEVLTK